MLLQQHGDFAQVWRIFRKPCENSPGIPLLRTASAPRKLKTSSFPTDASAYPLGAQLQERGPGNPQRAEHVSRAIDPLAQDALIGGCRLGAGVSAKGANGARGGHANGGNGGLLVRRHGQTSGGEFGGVGAGDPGQGDGSDPANLGRAPRMRIRQPAGGMALFH